jgi:hypothetical protein
VETAFPRAVSWVQGQPPSKRLNLHTSGSQKLWKTNPSIGGLKAFSWQCCELFEARLRLQFKRSLNRRFQKTHGEGFLATLLPIKQSGTSLTNHCQKSRIPSPKMSAFLFPNRIRDIRRVASRTPPIRRSMVGVRDGFGEQNPVPRAQGSQRWLVDWIHSSPNSLGHRKKNTKSENLLRDIDNSFPRDWQRTLRRFESWWSSQASILNWLFVYRLQCTLPIHRKTECPWNSNSGPVIRLDRPEWADMVFWMCSEFLLEKLNQTALVDSTI